MPYRITWEHEGLVAAFAGDCPIAELRDAFDEIHRDARVADLRYQIFDHRQVPHRAVTDSQLNEIVGLDCAREPTGARSLYASVSASPGRVDLIDYFIWLNAHPECLRQCATVEEAREWIRVQLGSGRSGSPMRQASAGRAPDARRC